MIKHHDKSNLGRKGFVSVFIQVTERSQSRKLKEVAKDSKLKAGTEAEAMVEWCLLNEPHGLLG